MRAEVKADRLHARAGVHLLHQAPQHPASRVPLRAFVDHAGRLILSYHADGDAMAQHQQEHAQHRECHENLKQREAGLPPAVHGSVPVAGATRSVFRYTPCVPPSAVQVIATDTA